MISISNHPSPKPFVIAEIGCNHAGEMGMAIKLVSVAASFCDVDAVKFQKRDIRGLLSQEEYSAPHPNPLHAFGASYGEHREFLEFNVDQHRELKTRAESAGTTYSTSVWDADSASDIVGLRPTFIKVPSASNQDFDLLAVLTDRFSGEIHISLGMTTRAEEQTLVDFLVERGALGRTVLFACTSGYPVPFEDVCLLEIRRLRETYGRDAAAIGFSGHHLGIAVDIAALALGATYFERHFTLDRTSRGTDHAASLEPDGLRRLVRDLRNVSQSIQSKSEEVLPIEKPQRDKLKRKLR